MIGKGIDVIEVLGVSPKIIVIAVIVYDCSLRMINCHAPAQDSSLREKTVISGLILVACLF